MKCYICDYSFDEASAQQLHSQCVFNQELLVRHMCPNCNVIFGNKRMLNLKPEELGYEYDELYKTYSEKDATDLELELLKNLSLTPTKTKRFINWGCGASNKTLDIATNLGYNVLGYDVISTTSSLIVNDLSLIQNESIDGIFSNNLIEHMQHPIKEFAQMNSKLKKGGLMIHATPCWNYCVEYTRFHLFFLGERGLKYLCDKTGFVVENEYPHTITPELFGYPNVNSNVKIFKKIK